MCLCIKLSLCFEGDGNSVDVKGSLFRGNSARYGGALVLKSFAFYLDKSSLSHHRVSDW